jgi:hypothetical protein
METSVSSFDRVTYVEVIPMAVARALAEDPHANLIQYVTHNISGGHEYWGDDAQMVYRSPQTVEEWGLASVLRDVLFRAAWNHVYLLEQKYEPGVLNLGPFGLRQDLSILLRYGHRLSIKDPPAGMWAKMAAARLCMKFAGISLPQFYDFHLRRQGDDHPVYTLF